MIARLATIADVRGRVAAARARGLHVGLVPTMGALHEGHLSLVRAARPEADLLIVSIFVNPTQFGPGEDLESYPRDLDADERLLAGLGGDAPDAVFVPDVDEMYPGERLTTVHVDRLGARLCGASRPGHFDGVTTVVAKLFNIVRPDTAWFGRKDFQQLTVIRRMVADLDVPVDVRGVPTVREPDGLALSSRNRYLGEDDRRAAAALSRALRAAVEAARDARGRGVRPDAEVLRDAALSTLSANPRVDLDYLEVVDPDTLAPPDAPRGDGDSGDRLLVAVAAHVGRARLIDNVVIGDADDEERLLSATAG